MQGRQAASSTSLPVRALGDHNQGDQITFTYLVQKHKSRYKGRIDNHIGEQITIHLWNAHFLICAHTLGNPFPQKPSSLDTTRGRTLVGVIPTPIPILNYNFVYQIPARCPNRIRWPILIYNHKGKNLDINLRKRRWREKSKTK